MAQRIFPPKETKEQNWETLSSEYIIKRPWLTARRDKLQMPNGHICDEWYVLEYPQWVNIIAITIDGQIIMERQYRHGLKRFAWEIPAGVVEQNETPEQAAKRELLEETGFGGGNWTEIMQLSANPTAMTNINYTFLATNVEQVSKPNQESSEDISVWLMSPNEVIDILKNGDIIQSLMAAPLWKYFAQTIKK